MVGSPLDLATVGRCCSDHTSTLRRDCAPITTTDPTTRIAVLRRLTADTEPAFLEAAKNADLVLGSRYVNGIRVINWPLRRLMLSTGDAQRVAELMRETAAAELLPRFRNLAAGEVREKRPGDVVTVADVASEQRLAVGLAKILPGVPVVGEEAVEKDPGLVDLIGRSGERCWVVDTL